MEKCEELSKDDLKEFKVLIQKFELNYNVELAQIILTDEESKLKVKIILYLIKEIYLSDRKRYLNQITRTKLIYIYDVCRKEYFKRKNTETEIINFYNYYYKSVEQYLINREEKYEG